MARLLLACAALIGVHVTTATQMSFQAEPIRQQDFSCRTFPADLSEADLIKRYGANNVRSAPVTGVDDGPQDGTVLYPELDAMKVEIVWEDPPTKSKLLWVRTQENGSRWRTPHGITVGMDLKTIERMNRRPFQLAALSTEGQGVISSWGNGQLSNMDTGDCVIRISLLPTEAGPIPPRSLQRQVLQGGGFSSGHPAMQAMNPRVVAIYLRPKLAR